MVSSKHFQTVVVGGGLVGKCAALLLAQQGLRVALIAPTDVARPPRDGWDSRVYALSSSSRALLKRLRVWQALDPARIEPVRDMQVFGDGPGARQGRLEFSAYGAAVGQLAWIVESSHIERVLDAALGFQHQLTRLDGLGAELRAEPGAAHAVLTLADGREAHAECVIGADGANSWVRSQCGIESRVTPYGQVGVVANFRAGRPHHGTARQWFLGAGQQGEILALLPLPDGHLSMVWSAGEAHAQELQALAPEALCAAVAAVRDGAVGDVTGALECVTPARGFPLAMLRAQRLIAPRVALVGDAAHAIHPLAGQGMNLGLRDVVQLGDILAARETFRDCGDVRLLRRYERARRGDMELMALTMHGLHALFALPGAVPEMARNAGMQLVGALAPVRRFLIERALG